MQNCDFILSGICYSKESQSTQEKILKLHKNYCGDANIKNCKETNNSVYNVKQM